MDLNNHINPFKRLENNPNTKRFTTTVKMKDYVNMVEYYKFKDMTVDDKKRLMQVAVENRICGVQKLTASDNGHCSWIDEDIFMNGIDPSCYYRIGADHNLTEKQRDKLPMFMKLSAKEKLEIVSHYCNGGKLEQPIEHYTDLQWKVANSRIETDFFNEFATYRIVHFK